MPALRIVGCFSYPASGIINDDLAVKADTRHEFFSSINLRDEYLLRSKPGKFYILVDVQKTPMMRRRSSLTVSGSLSPHTT